MYRSLSRMAESEKPRAETPVETILDLAVFIRWLSGAQPGSDLCDPAPVTSIDGM